MPDLGPRLDKLDDGVRELTVEVRREREDRTAATKGLTLAIKVATAVGLLLIFAVGGFAVRSEQNRASTERQRISQRDQSRCDIRSGFIDIANASHASEALTLQAIRDYDRRLAALGSPPCGGVALCRDGTYSESTGQGACSHHDGVARILIR